ncbi:hypothetical protein D3C81_1360150 [compost metagenome]
MESLPVPARPHEWPGPREQTDPAGRDPRRRGPRAAACAHPGLRHPGNRRRQQHQRLRHPWRGAELPVPGYPQAGRAFPSAVAQPLPARPCRRSGQRNHQRGDCRCRCHGRGAGCRTASRGARTGCLRPGPHPAQGHAHHPDRSGPAGTACVAGAYQRAGAPDPGKARGHGDDQCFSQ